LNKIDNRQKKMPADNERFGASGGVARPKVSADLEVLRPSERQWKPRLRQAARTLAASGRQCSGLTEKVKREINCYKVLRSKWTISV
jgi:hypothetical protein